MKTQLLTSLYLTVVCLPTLLFSQNIKLVEKNKAHIKMAYEALNQRNFDLFFQLVSPEFTEYSGPMPLKGRQNIESAYRVYMKAFPDLKFNILSISNEGNKYYSVVQSSGTNGGSVMDMFPPTGKKST